MFFSHHHLMDRPEKPRTLHSGDLPIIKWASSTEYPALSSFLLHMGKKLTKFKRFIKKELKLKDTTGFLFTVTEAAPCRQIGTMHVCGALLIRSLFYIQSFARLEK